jgi:hypothetical protein
MMIEQKKGEGSANPFKQRQSHIMEMTASQKSQPARGIVVQSTTDFLKRQRVTKTVARFQRSKIDPFGVLPLHKSLGGKYLVKL